MHGTCAYGRTISGAGVNCTYAAPEAQQALLPARESIRRCKGHWVVTLGAHAQRGYGRLSVYCVFPSLVVSLFVLQRTQLA